MQRLRSILGNTGAIVTLAAALLTPFLLMGWFENAIVAAGLRTDPTYTGGEPAHTIQCYGYRIVVNHPVRRRSPLQRVDPFVQLTWTPADRLPAQVSDAVDIDGDGVPDVRVNLSLGAGEQLVADVAPLNRHYRAMHTRGATSFSALVARVRDGIVVRLPVE